MEFKSIHKISIIQEKFLVFFNLLRGPDVTPSGPAGRGLCIPGLIDQDLFALLNFRAPVTQERLLTRTPKHGEGAFQKHCQKCHCS